MGEKIYFSASAFKYCVLLQNYCVTQRNFAFFYKTFTFCKQTQRLSWECKSFASKHKININIQAIKFLSRMFAPILFFHHHDVELCKIIVRVCVSKEITTVIRTNCYILTWCALYCTWHIFLQRVNAEKSSTVTSYKSKYQRKCYSSRHTCSMNLFSAVYD